MQIYIFQNIPNFKIDFKQRWYYLLIYITFQRAL